MNNSKLKDRINSYAEIANFKLLPRLPLVFIINMRSASKITALLEKPYSQQFMETLCSTMLKLIQEIDGTIFGYAFNDEIVLISRNDQSNETQPWNNNQIQKMCSVVSSIATLEFNKYAKIIGMELLDAIFISSIFTAPNITEAMNVVISKQQQNFQSSIQFACFYELLKKDFNQSDIKELTGGLNIDAKIELLLEECGVAFNDYPLPYRRGIACYRMPTIIKVNESVIEKSKLQFDADLPVFTKDQEFLRRIFKAG